MKISVTTNKDLKKETGLSYTEMCRKNGLYQVIGDPDVLVYSKGKLEVKPLFIHTNGALYLMTDKDISWQSNKFKEYLGEITIVLTNQGE